MRFAEPGWLVLLLLMPLPWLWTHWRPRLSWPTLQGFARAPRAAAGWISQVPLVLRALALACLAVALARPQSVGGQTRIAARGVAIVVVLDRSGSMETTDFPADGQDQPLSRLEAARRTMADFVRGRPDDLIGLVVFANEPDLACPLTLDHRQLLEAIQAIRPARAGEDGTNLGDAVAEGLGALRTSTPSRKVLILLTDGQNRPAVSEPPPMAPESAAELVRALGCTLHAIGLGRSDGNVRSPLPETAPPLIAEGGNLDRDLLQRMARFGGGRAFDAADTATLAEIFRELDTLEKSPVTGRVFTRYREEYAPWVAGTLVLLALDLVLRQTRLRSLP